MRNAVRAMGAVTCLAIFGLGAETIDAQTTLGVRGGVSTAGLSGDIDEVLGKSNRTGFTGGVFLDWGGTGLFGFQVGAQYSQKGAELDFGDAVADLSLSYLEIPAVIKLGVPLGAAKASLLGGVGLGFNTGCDLEGDGDCGDDVSSTNWAGILGADVAFYLASVSLWFDGRYHFGLSDITDSADFDELKTRAWAFQAGLGFPLGG